MTDRPTGRTVTLPLVWREVIFLCLGDQGQIGDIHRWHTDEGLWGAWARSKIGGERTYLGDFPTRSAAERAVEDAVVKALGAEGGGDEM